MLYNILNKPKEVNKVQIRLYNLNVIPIVFADEWSLLKTLLRHFLKQSLNVPGTTSSVAAPSKQNTMNGSTSGGHFDRLGRCYNAI